MMFERRKKSLIEVLTHMYSKYTEQEEGTWFLNSFNILLFLQIIEEIYLSYTTV